MVAINRAVYQIGLLELGSQYCYKEIILSAVTKHWLFLIFLAAADISSFLAGRTEMTACPSCSNMKSVDGKRLISSVKLFDKKLAIAQPWKPYRSIATWYLSSI
jgi:hypothetical protein